MAKSFVNTFKRAEVYEKAREATDFHRRFRRLGCWKVIIAHQDGGNETE